MRILSVFFSLQRSDFSMNDLTFRALYTVRRRCVVFFSLVALKIVKPVGQRWCQMKFWSTISLIQDSTISYVYLVYFIKAFISYGLFIEERAVCKKKIRRPSFISEMLKSCHFCSSTLPVINALLRSDRILI